MNSLEKAKGLLSPNNSEATEDLSDAGRERENAFEHFRGLREKYDLQINKVKCLSFLDYILSLELDPSLFKIAHRRKLDRKEYVHFFELELKNGLIEKGTTKWIIKKRLADFITFNQKLTKELVDSGRLTRQEVPQLYSFYNTKKEGPPELFLEAAETYLRELLESSKVRAHSMILYEFLELSLLPLANGPQKFKEGYLKKKSGGRFKNNKLKIYCSTFFARWQQRWFILTEEGILYTINSNSIKAREMLLFDQTFKVDYGRKATGSHFGISLHTPNRRLNLQASDLFEALDWVGEIKKAAKASPYTKTHRFLSFAPVRDPTHYCKWYVDAEGYFEDLHNALIKAKREVFITDWWLSPEVSLKRPVKDSNSEYRLDKILGKIAESGVKVYIIVYHEVKMVMYNDSEHTKQALESMSKNITVLKHPSEPFFSWSHHEKLVVIDQQVGFVGGFDLCFGRWDSSAHPVNDPSHDQEEGETYQGQDYCNPRLVDFKNVTEHSTPLIDKSCQPRMPFHDAMVQVIGPVVADMCRHFIQYWNHVEVDVYDKQQEAPLPLTNLQPPPKSETVKRDNATMKLRGAFRKVFGIRSLATGLKVNEMKTDGVPVNSAQTEMKAINSKSEDANSMKGTQSTLPSLSHGLETDNKEHDNDEAQTLLSPKKKHLSKFAHKKEEEEKEEDKPSSNTSLDEGMVSEKQPPNHSPEKPTDEDTLLKNKGHKIWELTGFRKYFHALINKGATIIGYIMHKAPVVSNPVHEESLNAIAEHADEADDEDKEYKQKYANLLKSIKDKEKDYDIEFQKNHSKRHKGSPPIHPLKRRFGRKPHEEKFRKEVTDQFYEKNMLQLLFTPKEEVLEGTVSCQMVRSASKWSLGLNSEDGNIENSIQNAYIELIQNAKNFIYIENQFFMSGTAGKVVQNEVAHAILYRIEKAHAKGEKFRVIIFLPLMPSFEGEIHDSKAALLRVQMHWQYMTICTGGESIYEQLRKKGIKPEDYIQFYSLRNHGKMKDGTPATEMIYIHSKILIIDDDIMLIGSANINDRSLQGSRDSEIAMIFEDTKKVPSKLGGKEVEVSEFSHTFRKRLLAEHTGLTEDEVQDPMSEEFTKILNQRAQENTDIYREIFACYPDDTVKKLSDLEEFSKKRDLAKYDELAPKIKGHVVWFPLEFCLDDELTAPINTMEYFLPDQTFV